MTSQLYCHCLSPATPCLATCNAWCQFDYVARDVWFGSSVGQIGPNYKSGTFSKADSSISTFWHGFVPFQHLVPIWPSLNPNLTPLSVYYAVWVSQSQHHLPYWYHHLPHAVYLVCRECVDLPLYVLVHALFSVLGMCCTHSVSNTVMMFVGYITWKGHINAKCVVGLWQWV